MADLSVITLLIEPDPGRGAVEFIDASVPLLARFSARDVQSVLLFSGQALQVA